MLTWDVFPQNATPLRDYLVMLKKNNIAKSALAYEKYDIGTFFV
jgi:hypothetical protein